MERTAHVHGLRRNQAADAYTSGMPKPKHLSPQQRCKNVMLGGKRADFVETSKVTHQQALSVSTAITGMHTAKILVLGTPEAPFYLRLRG